MYCSISAKSALQHAWFQDLRDAEKRSRKGAAGDDVEASVDSDGGVGVDAFATPVEKAAKGSDSGAGGAGAASSSSGATTTGAAKDSPADAKSSKKHNKKHANKEAKEAKEAKDSVASVDASPSGSLPHARAAAVVAAKKQSECRGCGCVRDCIVAVGWTVSWLCVRLSWLCVGMCHGCV